MNTATKNQKIELGPESNGMRMTPREFDQVEECDENYRYELIHGVLVVHPISLPTERGPNELLGYYLLTYQENHPEGKALADTLPQEYVRTGSSRRIADRLIWTGLGRLADRKKDVPTIAVEFVSKGRRNWQRDYVDKKREYGQVGIKEYWIIDRFQRTLTVVRYRLRPKEIVVTEMQTYQSPHLPGFELYLARILEAADRRARMEKVSRRR